MWSTILCTDVVGIDYLFNSRNLNQLIFVEKGLLSRFLPTFAKTCTLYLKPFGMLINTGVAERYMLFEHVPNMYLNMYLSHHSSSSYHIYEGTTLVQLRYMFGQHVPNGKPFIHWDSRRFRYKVHVVAQKSTKLKSKNKSYPFGRQKVPF